MISSTTQSWKFYTWAVLTLLLMLGVANSQNSDQSEFRELSPGNPAAYFLLGETLMARANDLQDQQLATEVLVIGVTLAMQNNDKELAASMCITLAANENDSELVAELWDLALFLDPARKNAWVKFRNSAYKQEEQLRADAIKCLHSVRFSQPDIASPLLARPDVQRLLTITAQRSGIEPNRFLRSLSSLLDDAQNDSCRGRIFITRRDDGVVTREVCSDHLRPIGTAASDESLNELLLVESLLVSPYRSGLPETDWGIVSYLQLDSPVDDPSVSKLLEHYGVDRNKPYRKGNQWVSSR